MNALVFVGLIVAFVAIMAVGYLVIGRIAENRDARRKADKGPTSTASGGASMANWQGGLLFLGAIVVL